jgi:hypothetical protein
MCAQTVSICRLKGDRYTGDLLLGRLLLRRPGKPAPFGVCDSLKFLAEDAIPYLLSTITNLSLARLSPSLGIERLFAFWAKNPNHHVWR